MLLKRFTSKQWRRIRERARNRVRRALNRSHVRRPNINLNKLDSKTELIPIELKTTPLTEIQVRASICRSSFYEFFKEFWPEYTSEKLVDNWHIRYICQEMQKCAERVFAGERKEYDEIFNVPPGTSKSTICSRLFPIWVWTRMPEAVIICCSFSEKLALRLSRDSRRIVKSDKYKSYFPEVEIRSDQDTQTEFSTTKNGSRIAVGCRSQIMGSHANFIVIDDPIDPEAVLSEIELENVHNWIKEQLGGRKKNKLVTVTFLIMQRLHQNDPAAVMGQKKKIKWVKIPATDQFQIQPIGLKRYYKQVNGIGYMDPSRLSQEALDDVLEGPRGDYVFAGQFGQEPVPPGGGMFKTKRIVLVEPTTKLPRFKHQVRFWDKAGTLGSGAYTVGIKMGLTSENRIFILDVVRVQLDSWEREKLIRQTARMDGSAVIVGLEQEGGSGGKESVENTVRRLIGYKCKVINPKGKKEERADPFSTQVNSGNVYMVKRDWNSDYLEELKYFPFSTFKDQVDASSGCLTVLLKGLRKIGGMRRGPNMTSSHQRRKLIRLAHSSWELKA